MTYGDMEENVSGCFFSEHSVYYVKSFCAEFEMHVLSILEFSKWITEKEASRETVASLLSLLQSMSGACLFLAAKVEEQPRKLEHVIRTGYVCTHRDQPPLDIKSDVSHRYRLMILTSCGPQLGHEL